MYIRLDNLLNLQRVWWFPLTWVGIPTNFILHTIFDVEKTTEGFVYTRQEVPAPCTYMPVIIIIIHLITCARQDVLAMWYVVHASRG